jgi:hypothetical protein
MVSAKVSTPITRRCVVSVERLPLVAANNVRHFVWPKLGRDLVDTLLVKQ